MADYTYMKYHEDRRERIRTDFVTEVTLTCENQKVSVTTEMKDISIMGMFVRTDHDFTADSICEVVISIAAKNSRLILDNISAKVVRISEEGVALQFTSNMEWFVLFKIYTHHSKKGLPSAGALQA